MAAAAAAKTPVKQQRQHGNRKTAMTAMAPPIFSYANHDGDDSSAVCCPWRCAVPDEKEPPKSIKKTLL
ncbi:hypothetical protein MRB53_008828 [Persea americana]|uniref:Uncharacterized protein n=1 Tax=Persea americana TaxID=3435 RepID=A0ACC2LMD3_PERAE|nr:hypothetical protein MRB53_008828 [Persea americana]